jgi:hypothetical protein
VKFEGVELQAYNRAPELDEIYQSFQLFCGLFLQNTNHQGDLFDVGSWKTPWTSKTLLAAVRKNATDYPVLIYKAALFALRMINENNRPRRKDPEIVYELLGYPTVDSPNKPLYIDSWEVEPREDHGGAPAAPIADKHFIKLERILEEKGGASSNVDQSEVSLGSAVRTDLWRREPFPTMDEADKEYLETVIEISNGNISEAARRAGLNRSTFSHRCKKLGL